MTPHAIAADLDAVEQDLRAAEAVERSAWVRYVNVGDEHKPAWVRAQSRLANLRARRRLLRKRLRDQGAEVRP